MEIDPEACYRAVASRDRRFEGRFVVAVRTTGIYCRPGCPAPLPRERNCLFLPCPAAAEERGFRPCRRCRPETAPGTPAWSGTSATISRALRLIEEGALDGDGTEGLAARLGLGERQLRRLFAEHLGASPAAVARTRRVHFARRLVDETSLPLAEVAFGAGFGSLRSFNETFRATFGRPPGELRRSRAGETARAAGGNRVPLTLRLPYRPPYDWPFLYGFLAARAVPGVESVADGVFRRTLEADGAAGFVEVEAAAGSALALRVHLPASRGLGTVVARVTRFLDVDADPLAIGRHLSLDPRLAGLVAARPGLRVPGALTPFEGAVRAILAQQVSVGAARTLCGRLVSRFGEELKDGPPGLDRLFPGPDRLAHADLEGIGLTGARAAAVRALAGSVARSELRLSAPFGLDELVGRLTELPGVGSWTAQVVALRALGEPDAFPAGDLALRKAFGNGGRRPAAADLERASEAWRPFRAYAAVHLWAAAS